MNIVLIMTDTQTKEMVGCYGQPQMDTPNLDRLAAEGVRFERAYTACPLCTPARGALFSGLYPQVNGAWCNNLAPARNIALAGDVFRHYGYRAAYTGKWHLDGTAYFGSGEPDGGFEPEWWYDGYRYAKDIGPAMFRAYRSCRTPEEVRRAGFDAAHCWGHRVADRAIDFLEQVGDEPFLLVASFDEPHGPSIAPPEYWERFQTIGLLPRPNFNAPLEDKPALHRVQRAGRREAASGPDGRLYRPRLFGCNSYVDREIGRVLDAVDRRHREDTAVIYTADHGDQLGSHGLSGKGPMMYEESCNVPLIIRAPGTAAGTVSHSLVSHVDLLPTMLAWAGIEQPEVLHGRSIRPALEDAAAAVREVALVSYHRFGIAHESFGEFYPIRCVTDGRYKLVINLFETDEFYDLQTDPFELTNRIDDAAVAAERDRLHEALLDEMTRIRDPFRSFRWGRRPWRQAREPFYRAPGVGNPKGFSFQPDTLRNLPPGR